MNAAIDRPVVDLLPVTDLFPRSLEIQATGMGGAIVRHGHGGSDEYQTYFTDFQEAWVLTGALVHPSLNVMPQGNC
jgi:hypothetical protein